MIGNKDANFFKRNLPVIIAFLIPVIALAAIFIWRDVFPFGDEMYLRSDMYHQYAPFMRAFQRAIQEGRSLNYIWEIGLGSNFSSTYAYYLASPLNWLIALFPQAVVPAVMDAFIVFKCGLMSAFFTFYLIKKFNKISYFAPVFGVFYAMSAYMAAFSWNLMWLDCLLLLPLIMLGLERLVKENKTVLYTITLAIAILSNYYIAIMIAIFLVIYFIYLMICDGKAEGSKRRTFSVIRKRIFSFIWYSFIAGLMAMAVLLPAIFALSGTASGTFDFPDQLIFYNNFLAVLSKGAILTEPAVFSGYFPNIYCTCALFILIPLFWTNRNINLKRKIGLTLIMAIFLFCFNTNIPTYIWHGFHFPNSLPSRQAFIFVAIILICAYEAIIRYEDYSKLQIMLIGGWGIIGNIIFYLLFREEEFTLLSGLVTVGFIIVYSIIMIFLKNKKLGIGLLTVILFIVGVGETTFNTAYTGYSTAGYKNYVEDNRAISELLEANKSDDFYRVEKISRRTKNDGTWSDYKSASIFSSATLGKVTDFYNIFGMQSSFNAFSYYGHTPIISTFLDVKYELSKNEINDDLKSLVAHAEYGEDEVIYLYENKNVAGPGFAVNYFDDNDLYVGTSHPFNSQNVFFENITEIPGLYDVQENISGVQAEGSFENDGRGMIYITNKIETAKVVITRGDTEVMNKEFSELENPQVIDLGNVKKGDKISVEAADEENSGTELDIIVAVMNNDIYEEICSKLLENQFVVTEYDEGYMKVNINIEEGQTLITSIPADNGWQVYVDGKRAELSSVLGAFLRVDLPEGSHEVEFKYSTPGQLAGVILSAIGILLFIFSMIYRKAGRPKKIMKTADGPSIDFDEQDDEYIEQGESYVEPYEEQVEQNAD